MSTIPQGVLHFIVFPLMAPGHMIPMIDIAKMLAQQGVMITIFTTPINAKRFEPNLARAIESGLHIKIKELQFPSEESGLPKGCENFDMLPSLGLGPQFFKAGGMVQPQVEKLFEELSPRPTCIISDGGLPYTSRIATKFGIPRVSFNGTSSFCNLCLYKICISQVLESVASDSETFVVPDTPGHIEFSKSQLPGASFDDEEFIKEMEAAEMATYGVIVNSFEELETVYLQEYRKIKGDKLWSIGPVVLSNRDNLDMLHRGNKASNDLSEYLLNWLDSQESESVIYACLGSICNLIPSQLMELGLGLESSKKSFIWVIHAGERSAELEKLLKEDRFEERTKAKGLILRGWVPQVVVLSHPAIGGFITHCGWNSTLEAISAGMPMITWPLFGDQFLNEKLVVEVLSIGVKVGTKCSVPWGREEKAGVLVKREDVKKAIERLMSAGEESKERRRKAKELNRLAKEAMEEDGSSSLNLKMLIHDIWNMQVQKPAYK